MLSLVLILTLAADAPDKPAPWLLARAFKLPSVYTNQESGYFSIVGGLDSRLYIGAAKYGVNAYLLEFDPKAETTRLVMDVHQVIRLTGTGFAAQAKIHTRNNVGESGKIYVGSKQGYPEKGEHRCDYPGGYVLVHDPKTGKNEHFGIAKAQHGIISVMPDESRGLAYVSTCSDDRPIDGTHFMVLDLKARKYTDLGDMQQAYAFIVLDHKGRAYHPVRGGTVARYDPATKKLERLSVTVDGKPAGLPFTNDGDACILNWDTSPDRKTLWAVEMSTNALYRFDLTATGKTLAGKRVGELLASKGKPRRTDCRAMCVGPDGTVWAAVTEQGLPGGPQLHLVRYGAKDAAPRDVGRVGLANPAAIPLTDDKGKPRSLHHCLRKEKDGVLTPWVPMGVAATRDGGVWITTIAPFVLLKVTKEQASR